MKTTHMGIGPVERAFSLAGHVIRPDVCVVNGRSGPARLARALLALLAGAAAVSASAASGSPSRGFAPIHGARIFFEMKGRGAPVVLIHGGNLDSRIWDGQFDRLAREFRVIRYDIPPFGRSSRIAPRSSVEDLRALFDVLSIDRAALVGLSLGARIAIDFALRYPDRVDRLVLAGPGLTGYPWRGDEALAAMERAAASGETRRAVELWLSHPYMTPAMANRAIAGRIRQLAMDNRPAWGIPQINEEVSDPPAMGRLGNIHVPTLIVIGARDVPDIQSVGDILERGITGARRVEIAGVGHLVNMEAPDRFNELVFGFLRKAASHHQE